MKTRSKPTRETLFLGDVMTGLFAALSAREPQVRSFAHKGFFRAFYELQAAIREEAEKAGLKVRFDVRLNPIHGDSPDLYDALYEAAQRNLISLDNPRFKRVRMKVGADDAPSYLCRLPGEPAMYKRLADEFVRSYSAEKVGGQR